ncbi:MAG: electron transport complex subunit RsxC, partial [Christensenellaceae bacterium]|nr:electron transport complex subunit RsxC [Christensenellaceae bacterium]
PLCQYVGKTSVCLVEKGDLVKVGQLIGEAQGDISANIHSSVSGKVVAVERVMVAHGNYVNSVIIDNDFNDTWVELEECKDYSNLSKEEIIEKIKKAGVVGLGGAAFPTHVKLSPEEEIDTLIINAVECEPYISADHRLMLEHPDEIINGISIAKKVLNAKNVIIGIEDNKPDAIALLSDKVKDLEGFSVMSFPVVYPQGGEKQLIYAATKRKVKIGKLPASVGVIVLNVATCFAIYEAVRYGKPVVERIVTIAGNFDKPKNLKVRIGTPVEEIVREAGGLKDSTKMIVMGGPMMGEPIIRKDIPLTKGYSGIIALEEAYSDAEELPCIRCGRCGYNCPMKLSPSEIDRNVRNKKILDNEKYQVMSCIECGVCSWSCPSKRRLTQSCKLSKYYIKQKNSKKMKG